MLADTATTSQVMISSAAAASADAWCLDGSPPVYYISRGTQSSKWMIWHEGGDWCDRVPKVQMPGERGEWSCLHRSRKRLGSSTHEDTANARTGSYPVNLSDFGEHFEFLSRNQSRNWMHGWNHVFVRYCDGGSFAGTSRQRIRLPGKGIKETTLYFRGRAITKVIISDLLENQGLAEASDVVIAGSSAGGLGVLMQGDDWSASIAEHVKSQGRVAPRTVLLIDSGFFPAYQAHHIRCRYKERMAAVFRLHKPSSIAFRKCRKAHAAEPWLCMFGTRLLPHISTPLFAYMSAYDSWGIPRVLCAASESEIDNAGHAFRNEVLRSFHATSATINHAIYIDSCRHHTKCWSGMLVDGDSPASAFYKWYHSTSQRRTWVDETHYGNPKCDTYYHETACPVGLNLTSSAAENL
eukprot:jgi/Tetstr1/424917/TSEL_015411.t1